ncbi:MAG: TIGR02186 family protein [Pseudomonadota bacterium]
MLRAFFILVCLALPAQGEEVVAGLSQNRVAITTNFDGSEILIFGAVRREAPIPDDAPLEVIVAVSGPSEPVVVRKKARRYGIWVNDERVDVDAAPTFYAVATSGPWDEVISDTEDLRRKISVPRAIRSVGAPMDVANAESFAEAVVRIRKDEGLYQVLEDTVTVQDSTLFNTSIALPANLTEGEYQTRIFLTRNRQVIDEYSTVINVQKVGLERWLYNLAHQQPLQYGLLSLTIAILAGWGASAFFRYLRG